MNEANKSPFYWRYRRPGAVTLVAIIAFIMLLFLLPEKEDPRTLLELMRALRADLDAPGKTVADAAKALGTPDKAFDFVRRDIRYVPYPDHLQSPDTVLRTRIANGLDRSVLLQSLLDAMGVKTRLVTGGPLPVHFAPSQVASPRARPPLARTIMKRVGYTEEMERKDAEQSAQNFSDEIAAIRDEVAVASDIFKQTVGFGANDPKTLRWKFGEDNVWVWLEVTGKSGGSKLPGWYDPMFPDRERPAKGVTAFSPRLGPTRIGLTLNDRFGRKVPLLTWSGEAIGRDISLMFMPAVDTATRLQGAIDPSDINLWIPVLQVDDKTVLGKPFAVDGATPNPLLDTIPYSPDKPPATDVKIENAAIADIDTGSFPRVVMALDVTATAPPRWQAGHFKVTEDGVTRPVRIESLSFQSNPILLVTDISGSMAKQGRIELARTAVKSLIDTLPVNANLGLIRFNNRIYTDRKSAPLGDRASLSSSIDSLLKPRGGTAVLNAVQSALSMANGKPMTAVLLTDGIDSGYKAADFAGKIETLLKNLRGSKLRIFALGLGNPDETLLSAIATASGGAYFKAATAEELPDLYRMFGSVLSGRVVISYDAPEQQAGPPVTVPTSAPAVPDTDTAITPPDTTAAATPNPAKRQVSVKIAGYETSVDGAYVAPAQPSNRRPALQLSMTTGPALNPASRNRTIVDLAHPDARWLLLGSLNVLVDAGAISEATLTARRLDQWIASAELAGDLKPASQVLEELARGLSYRYGSTVNSFRAYAEFGAGGAHHPSGPNIYLMRQAPVRRAGNIVDGLAFDATVYYNFGRLLEKPEDRVRWAAAATAAEGRIVGGDSALRPLIAARKSIVQLKGGKDAKAPAWLAAPLEALRAHDPGVTYLAAPDNGDVVWSVESKYHTLHAYVASGGVLNKGASAESTAAQFAKVDKIYEYIGKYGSSAAGSAGIPAAPLIAAIAAMKREELKLWCYSSVMLGFVSEAIGDTDNKALLNQSPDAATAKAAKLCKINSSPEQTAAGIFYEGAKAGAKKWASSIAKGLVKNGPDWRGIGSAAEQRGDWNAIPFGGWTKGAAAWSGGKVGSGAVDIVMRGSTLPSSSGFQTAVGTALSKSSAAR